MSATTVALLTFAVALTVPTARPATDRLRGLRLDRPPPGRLPAAGDLRPAWVLVGAAAAIGLGWAVAGLGGAAVLGVGTAVGLGVARHRQQQVQLPVEPVTALAGAWELLAVCLTAGLPVSVAIPAATASLDGRVGARLHRTAGLLELGADPEEAWRAAEGEPALAAFARSAGRSAATGAGLAQVAETEAARLRAELADRAQAGAQRAGVLITAPLGLCFLPAFLALGIAPVLVGLAGEALARW